VKLQIKHILFLAIAVVFSACATVVPPDGGAKDTTPPTPLSFHPENKTRNFKSDKIIIKFDEFIQLKDLQSQLVVSPAMPEKPTITIKGKKLIIEPSDSLESNTTYTIFLGNSVVNFTENLPIRNFQYVLATGEYLDSLRILGSIKNAFDLKTEEGILVMLYKNPSDSAPYLQRPYYLAKTFGKGEFLLDNLSAGKYQIFALKDLNSNYIYDQPDEEIAFVDSLIIPCPVKPADDTLNLITPIMVELSMFKEKEKVQGLLSHKVINQQQIQFIFRKSAQNIRFELVKNNSAENWYYPIYSTEKDSVKLWITKDLSDTIFIKINDNELIMDTVRLVLRKPERRQVGRQNRNSDPESDSLKPAPVTKLRVSTNAGAGLDFFSYPSIICTTPLKSADINKIQFLKMMDTVSVAIPFEIIMNDTISSDRILIKSNLEEASVYKIFMPDSVLFDIFNNTNDSLDLRFATTKKRGYGSLKLEVNTTDSIPLIIQLLNEKDMVLQENTLIGTTLFYPYLKPGNYKIKAISDHNKNGKWDTGDYLEKKFPEKVFYLNQILSVRANWDVEHKWIIE
jgi:hypothetical protein